MHRIRVRVVEDALDANNTIARANRADFDRHGVTVVNLMSAPGAGKTSLLESLLADGVAGTRVGVLEGDVQGSLDADRLASLHVPVTQLNTDPGFGGECHLDANMVRSALPQVPLDEIDLLVIENVGNLVCPAEFRVGEDARVMVFSVTEGEDKPLKYPLMFRTCDLVLVNKIDLLPHLDVDLDRFLYNLDLVHPDVPRMLVSAKTGEGVDAWRDWLASARRRTGGRRRREPGSTATDRLREAGRAPARGASRGEPAFLRGGGRAHRVTLPPGRGAVRTRRTAARARLHRDGALGRPARRGRVRSSRDRRQAGAAGGRARGESGPVLAQLACSPRPTTS